MRNRIGIILLVFVFAVSAFGGFNYSGGSGEPNDPFLIANADDLQQIAYEPNDWDKCFKMITDVNLADRNVNFDIIAGVDRYSYFSGVFDGNGHTINGLKIEAYNIPFPTYRSGVGLFYCVQGETAEVKNLGITNADVNGLCNDYLCIATLAGIIGEGARVTNCYAEGCQIKNGRNVGGLVGSSDGIISNCYTTWDVTGVELVSGQSYEYCEYSVGGLVNSNDGVISNCYTTGNITSTATVGGLVCNNDGVISNCYTTGNITGNGTVGGLVAFLAGDSGLIDCYTTGDVSNGCNDGDDGASGGLVGKISGDSWDGSITILRCYSTGMVSGSRDVGGLIGLMHGCDGVKVVDSYATGDNNAFISVFKGVISCGGLIGRIRWAEIDNEIINCYARGDVNCCDESFAGGLIGVVTDGYGLLVRDCNATGNVSLTSNLVYGAEEGNYSGGLVGYCENAKLENCYATGDVNGLMYVGGLVGLHKQYCHNSIITDCYASGDVNGIDYVGGFAGALGTEIYNCYSTGLVINSGDDINNTGGFVGLCQYHGSIVDCFWDFDTSSMLVGIGSYEGISLEELNVQGKSTSEMKRRETFVDAGWDFVDVWGIGQGQTYPYLRQYSAADVSCDGVVNFDDFAILADRWLE